MPMSLASESVRVLQLFSYRVAAYFRAPSTNNQLLLQRLRCENSWNTIPPVLCTAYMIDSAVGDTSRFPMNQGRYVG